jgi:hypothetical protein
MAWAIDRNQKMRELIDESATPEDIEPSVPSDVSALLERTSGLSLAEMDKTIQELQKARNFLRNERERMRLEMTGFLRLTQAAIGSANAVLASIAKFVDDIPARNLDGGTRRREAA